MSANGLELLGDTAGEFFRAFAENCPDPAFICTRDERFVWCNEECLRVTGYSAEELSAIRLSDLIAPESRVRVAAAMRQRMASPRRMRHEFRIRGKNGVPVDVETFSWLVETDGQGTWIQAVARDISEVKRREASTRMVERAEILNLLAGGVAHDFNNILMSIYAYSDQLKSEADGLESLYLAADIIHRAAERGMQISSRLLRSTTEAKPRPVELDVHTTLRELAALLEQTIGQGIRVGVELNAKKSTVLADASQIYRLFLNLAMNARDAMPDGGTLLFRSGNAEGAEGELLYVEVRDSGTGIPSEILRRIFEPFFTTKEPDKGTGLGLAMAKAIVKHHHGHIGVENNADRGSTFRVYLPLARRSMAQ